MRIRADFSALSRTTPVEYALRFALGGVVTLIAGVIAQRFGPTVGGLFLAFPAIFPASVTLIAKHETEKKIRSGIAHSLRGRKAAALDATGAVLGSAGLAGFAAVLWIMLPGHSPSLALSVAVIVWFAVAFALWWLRRRVA